MDRAGSRQIVIEWRPDQPPSEEIQIAPGDPSAEQSPFDAMLADAVEFDWEQVLTF